VGLVQTVRDFNIGEPPSGWIKRFTFPISWQFGTGTDYIGYFQGPGAYEKRMYAQYATEEIPNDATIDKVEFVWWIRATIGAPFQWAIGFRIGTFIGGSLDSGDWNGGTVINNYAYPPGSPVGIWTWEATPTGTVRAAINKTGKTDIEYRDMSVVFFPATRQQQFSMTGVYPVLRVTYTYAHRSHKVAWTP
jgi:hypothetical protein